MSATGRSSAATSARIVTGAAASARSIPESSCCPAGIGSRPAIRSAIGSIATHGISSAIAAECVASRASIMTTNVGSLTDAIDVASCLLGDVLDAEADVAAEVVPRSGELVHDRLDQAAAEHPVDLAEAPWPLARSVRAAQQTLDRCQHELLLDRHQQARAERLDHDGDRQRMRVGSSACAAAHVTCVVFNVSNSTGARSSARQAPCGAEAEAVDGPRDPALVVGGELGRPREVDGPHPLPVGGRHWRGCPACRRTWRPRRARRSDRG